MPYSQHVELAGSQKTLRAHSVVSHNKDSHAIITVVLKKDIDLVNAIKTMVDFAHHYQLSVVDENVYLHTIRLTGTIQNLEKAFKVQLHQYLSVRDGKSFLYRGREGAIYVPVELEPFVLAVLGLDNRPIAKFHAKVRPLDATFQPQTAVEVAKKYQFPTDVKGKGQSIALVELGGGYNAADMQKYFETVNVPVPQITSISVGGGFNNYGNDPADGEVELDIQVAGAVAPEAHIMVVFAPNTDQGFLNAINNAARTANIVSISWGSPENEWTPMALQAFNQTFEHLRHIGVTVLVASGDNGSSDGEPDGLPHVDFPAASPYVLACGGTRLADPASESVWNDGSSGGSTGGGISNVFPLPSYQHMAVPPGGKGRHVPDVAGNADPDTGYYVVVDGQETAIGGTSAVAPLYAGLLALISEKLGRPLGFIHEILYNNHPDVFNDITTGSNGCYNAGKGYDCCTGLGSINGQALEKLMLAAFKKTK